MIRCLISKFGEHGIILVAMRETLITILEKKTEMSRLKN